MNPNYIVLTDGGDAIVAAYDMYDKTYQKMVTFHEDAWADTVSAAKDYVVEREKQNDELASSLLKAMGILGK